MPPALEAKQSDARSPECVDKVWDEQIDGAWAPGKASVSLLTTFLKCVQERDSAEAELAAIKILEMEPNNQLVKDLLAAMKQQDALDAEENAAEEEEEGDEDEESSEDKSEEASDEESSEEDSDDDTNEHDADAKNNE